MKSHPHRMICACLLAALFAGTAVMSPAMARGDGDGEAKGKAHAKSGKADRPDKADRAEKADRANNTERAEKADKAKGDASERAEKRTDAREARQGKRIEHGIKKGALTPDEVEKLNKQQQQIASLESSFKGDGKITKDEAGQLRDALDTASKNIWAEKHDTEGNQLAAYRLGKNVFAKDEITQKLSDPNLSKEEARKFTKDFGTLTSLKKSLATDNLTPEERAKKQARYNELLNQYFVVKD